MEKTQIWDIMAELKEIRRGIYALNKTLEKIAEALAR